MKDYWLVRQGSLQNEVVDGKIIGFKFDVRICEYRGCFLSLVTPYYIEVDGEEYGAETQTFEVNGKPPRTFDEIAKAIWEHWDYGDFATIHVRKPGGLKPGEHKLGVWQGLLTQYGWNDHDDEWCINPPIPGKVASVGYAGRGTGKQQFLFEFPMTVE